MKLYLIAGEVSGDFIGSKLMKSLKELNSDVRFEGIGGDKMSEEGLKSLFPISQIALMGFVEILPHIFRLKKLIKLTANDIVSKRPDALITIDSPGFTYRVASLVKKMAPDIKLIHAVAPSVWAYKPGRAQKYANLYDHLLTFLPFEPSYFTKLGLDTHFIGHIALEQSFYKKSDSLKEEMKIQSGIKIIAITPGSRKSEITRHMPVIVKALEALSEKITIKAIFVQPNENYSKYISSFLTDAKFDYTFSTDRLKSFAVSDCALAKSGTNTLEISASGTPMLVGYKMNSLTFFLLKLIIKVKYANLVNIIAGYELIPEYIQSNFKEDNIARALNHILSDNNLAEIQVKESQRILETIGLGWKEAPSVKAARIITDILASK